MTDTPEAPASMNVRFASTLGYEYLLTVRNFAEEKPGGKLLDSIPSIETKLQELGCKPIFGKNSGKAAAKSKAEGKPKTKPCPIHEGQNLFLRTNKETGQSWYSHSIDDTEPVEWCRGE